jgi:Fe2+-dicitrate sensor, membrane component
MNNDILQRYLEGNVTQQEREEVAVWLDADKQHMDEYRLLRNIYDMVLWNKDHLVSDKPNQEPAKRMKIVRELIKVAAILIIALGLYQVIFSTINNKKDLMAQQTIHVPEGQRAETMLADGTHVWLNASSSLIFAPAFAKDERIVELDGEAYFDVEYDESRPFVVKTKHYDIVVHGTEFNVKAYKENGTFEAALINGSIEVISNTGDERIVLTPNDKVYLENNHLVMTRIDTYDHFLWKEGILYFEKNSVKELFAKLELYYDVNIEVRKEEILDHQYTGKFWTKDGVEHVLRVLQLRHDFKYSKDDMNNIIIY